jgi:hypothetical protein
LRSLAFPFPGLLTLLTTPRLRGGSVKYGYPDLYRNRYFYPIRRSGL